MLKRLAKVIIFPVVLVILVGEIIVYGARWIVTGKEFPDSPIIQKVIFDW